MSLDNFHLLAQDEVHYEECVDFKAYFEKLISIWRTQCQSINRRIMGSTLIEEGSEEYGRIVERFPKELVEKAHQLRRMIPKASIFSSECYELSVFVDDFCAEFRSIEPIDMGTLKNPHITHPYRIGLERSGEKSCILSVHVAGDANFAFMKDNAFPAWIRWLRHMDLERKANPSNRLIDMESYSMTYRRIKETQGKQLAEAWTERTDPEKFVYEDCGIAAYLLELWKTLGVQPKKFADIGCGNGLLVHILNKEGVNGIGLDIRKRKIWDNLLAGTQLFESTVDPRCSTSTGIPSDVDFLIGNHSDELTPWMAVMAARLNCGFFVLPCCPFTFHGKFQSRVKGKSVYEQFMGYVKGICEQLGFEVKEDRLSIPSTKRQCFVCTIPPQGLVANLEDVIARLTAPKTNCKGEEEQFVARPKVEKTQNCSNVPLEMRVQMTKKIFSALIDGCEEVKDGWRTGGCLPLSTLLSLLTSQEKEVLKMQNGGLQTFIKNQHQVFLVQGGSVRVRDWRDADKWMGKKKGQKPSEASSMEKRSPCWMFQYHPDGCAVGEEKCRFRHEREERGRENGGAEKETNQRVDERGDAEKDENDERMKEKGGAEKERDHERVLEGGDAESEKNDKRVDERGDTEKEILMDSDISCSAQKRAKLESL